jgi:hypothetical protein
MPPGVDTTNRKRRQFRPAFKADAVKGINHLGDEVMKVFKV